MAIPGGTSGDEVLTRSVVNITSSSETALITGSSNNVYSILSILVCETAGNAETFSLAIDASNAGTDYVLIKDQALGAKETFALNETIVMSGTDRLHITAGGSCAISIYVSYVRQNFT